jgi:hypothetical protein
MEFDKPQGVKDFHNGLRIEHAVRIEVEPLPPYWCAEQKNPAWCEDAAEFMGTMKVPARLHFITVPTQSDVLNHMEATQTHNRIVSEW